MNQESLLSREHTRPNEYSGHPYQTHGKKNRQLSTVEYREKLAVFSIIISPEHFHFENALATARQGSAPPEAA